LDAERATVGDGASAGIAATGATGASSRSSSSPNAVPTALDMASIWLKPWKTVAPS